MNRKTSIEKNPQLLLPASVSSNLLNKSFLPQDRIWAPFSLHWFHFSHQDYLLADSCMIYGLHPKKKKNSLKATTNFIPSWVEAIL